MRSVSSWTRSCRGTGAGSRFRQSNAITGRACQSAERLFPVSHQNVRVSVTRGVDTLRGQVRDAGLIPVASRLTQAVEGIASVDRRPKPAA